MGFPLILGACPTLTVLLRRMTRNHLGRSRPEKKSSTYSNEYASGFSGPAASHLAASPSPRHEGNIGQAPSILAVNLISFRSTMSAPNTFYITTPIYYVNDVPHIGHAYTTVAADVLARYWRLRGRDVFFLTGLDEHGQKVQQAATKAGIDPQAHCDKLAPQFQALWKRLNISNNAFIRTTDGGHKSVVQRYLQQLYDNQQIYKADYTGSYCT